FSYSGASIPPKQGLPNRQPDETVVTRISNDSLAVQMLDGAFHGQLRLIPVVQLSSRADESSFTLHRTPIPVRVCFGQSEPGIVF
ncbi:MAG: hypothetical protein M1816_002810, partial [Peltula sp. TS41687]